MGVDIKLHSLLNSDMGEDERSASLPGLCSPHPHNGSVDVLQ
jgi:hypothetical protein